MIMNNDNKKSHKITNYDHKKIMAILIGVYHRNNGMCNKAPTQLMIDFFYSSCKGGF